MVMEPLPRMGKSTLGNSKTAKSKDRERLTGQLERVYEAVKGGRWLTLTGIAARTGDPEASISAQLRNLRKPRFGAYDIRKRRAGNRFEYTCAGKQSEDAIDDGGGRDVRRRRERLTDMIERVCSRSWTVSQALGLGWDTRSRSASDENLTAGALLVDDRLVHLAAFERFVRW